MTGATRTLLITWLIDRRPPLISFIFLKLRFQDSTRSSTRSRKAQYPFSNYLHSGLLSKLQIPWCRQFTGKVSRQWTSLFILVIVSPSTLPMIIRGFTHTVDIVWIEDWLFKVLFSACYFIVTRTIANFTECPLKARHCSMHFLIFNSFQPHKTPVRWIQ